jgi:hypothetical protein
VKKFAAVSFQQSEAVNSLLLAVVGFSGSRKPQHFCEDQILMPGELLWIARARSTDR